MSHQSFFKMAESSFVEGTIHADDLFEPTVSLFPAADSGAPDSVESSNMILERASSPTSPSLASLAPPSFSSSAVSSSSNFVAPASPSLAKNTSIPWKTSSFVLPFVEGLILDTSSRPWKLRGLLADLSSPIHAFSSSGFTVSGIAPVLGSAGIFEICVSPLHDKLSLKFPQGTVPSPPVASAQVVGSSELVATHPPESSMPKSSLASRTFPPLASPKMDSVRSSIKVPAGERALPQKQQVVSGRFAHQEQQASVPIGVLSGAACSSVPDPREWNSSASCSSTGTDPKEPDPDSAAFQSLGRPSQASDYSAPRADFCALSRLSRSSEAVFFSAPPGRGPVFPSWSSARKLYQQELRWKPLFAGVFEYKEAACYKWDLYAAPVLRKLFLIEGHPHWILRQVFIDDKARADSFALCRELYERASYYLSPAAMLWWVLARAQAAPGKELGSIGECPNRLHQVPQSIPVKMTDAYARLAASAKGVSHFWDQVWTVAVELLDGQPSAAGPAAPRPRQGVASLIGPCVWGPHEQKGSGPPDPGLTVPHLFRWELAWEIFYPTSSGSFVTSGKITCKNWEAHAAPRLHKIFGIASSLSPHWAQSGHINDSARAKSFRLCLRLYSKAAYFLSPALFLWWAVARVTARTRDELGRLDLIQEDSARGPRMSLLLCWRAIEEWLRTPPLAVPFGVMYGRPPSIS